MLLRKGEIGGGENVLQIRATFFGDRMKLLATF